MDLLTEYIILFAIYIIIVVAIGIISSRKESSEDFMIAKRKVQGLQLAATMSAGFFDGSTIAVYIAYVYLFGFSAIWMFIGLAIGFTIFTRYAPIIKKRADKIKAYTMPEYFYKTFGKKNGIMFSIILLLEFFLLLIVNLIVSGKVLSLIFPIPYYVAVIIGGIIVLSYLLLAGFKAVVKTDFFQVMIMFLMAGGVTILLLNKTTAIPSSEFNMFAMGFGNIIGWLVLTTFGIMVAPDMWQRIFATKDQKNLKKGLLYGAIILFLLGILMVTLGLITKQSFPNILPEDALVMGFTHLLPAVFIPIAMVLLYAVTLSSSDTITFVVSSIMTRDLKNYTKKYSRSSMKLLTRFFMVLFIALAIIISIFYQKIFAVGFAMASINLALFPVVFGSLFWKLERRAVFWSLVLALASIIIVFFTVSMNPQTAIICLPVAAITLFVLQKLMKRKRR